MRYYNHSNFLKKTVVVSAEFSCHLLGDSCTYTIHLSKRGPVDDLGTPQIQSLLLLGQWDVIALEP